MKKLTFIIFLSFLFATALSAADMVVRVSEENPGSNCTYGGMKIEVGSDDNGNTELDNIEVDQEKTAYVCNGANSREIVSVTDEPENGMCSPRKGVKIEIGNDMNGNGTLEEGEVNPAKTRYICDGADGKNAVSKISEESAGGACTYGGVKIEVGIDENGSGTLDEGEIDDSQTKYVCKGADGADGKNALAKVSDEPKGDNCPNSTGIKIETGIDTNGNGELDAGEVADTQYICNGKNGAQGAQGDKGDKGEPGKNGADGEDGAQGEKGDQGPKGDQGEQGATGATGEPGKNGAASLVSVVEEPKGENCAAGGKKIEVGFDANGNGTLDEEEIDPETVYYVCNGRDAEEAGLTSSSTGCSVSAVDGNDDAFLLFFAVIAMMGAFVAVRFARR